MILNLGEKDSGADILEKAMQNPQIHFMSKDLAYVFQRLDTTGQFEKLSYILNFDPLTSSDEFKLKPIFQRYITSLQSRFIFHKEYILSLDDDWDGDGAKKFNASIFKKIYSFLENFFENLWKNGIIIPNPELLPNSDGSVDINWQNQDFTLLINIPKEEVANYFIWRQQDATRNSINMLGQYYFSHKELQKKNTDQVQEMLFSEHGINWNDIPTWQKRGYCATPTDFDDEIPIFTKDRDYIERHLLTKEELQDG